MPKSPRVLEDVKLVRVPDVECPIRTPEHVYKPLGESRKCLDCGYIPQQPPQFYETQKCVVCRAYKHFTSAECDLCAKNFHLTSYCGGYLKFSQNQTFLVCRICYIERGVLE